MNQAAGRSAGLQILVGAGLVAGAVASLALGGGGGVADLASPSPEATERAHVAAVAILHVATTHAHCDSETLTV